MPEWIRCVVDGPGHEVDVDARALRPGLTPIPGYAPNSGPGATPRPAKHHVDKAGKPARRRADPPAPTSTSDPAATPQTEQEQS